MAAYVNIMEQMVENRLGEVMKQLNCCNCERCRADIAAFALNRLPAKYVVSPIGETYSKIDSLRAQFEADILSSLMLGANIVRENKRH